jgi:hypothetical protein
MNDIIGRLIFDSWTDDAPAIRGELGTQRHLIYEAADIVLDVILTPGIKDHEVHLTGQLLPVSGSGRSVSQVEVFMRSGSTRLRSRTSPLGEFNFSTTWPEQGEVQIIFENRRFGMCGLESASPSRWKVSEAQHVEAGQ